MALKPNITGLERKAKSLLASKEISQGKMEAVRSLMNNSRIDDYEKYHAIIDLLKNSPDKKNKDTGPKKNGLAKDKSRKNIRDPDALNIPEINLGPTETTLFIDEMYHKYKYLKIFRKRYLVHRDNRIGIGLRKRLIPSPRLLKIIKRIGEEQENILFRLTPILADILKDDSIEDPTIFNYLRIVRKWMMELPLVKFDFNSIKWMERHNFEKEFSVYLTNYFSFLRMIPDERERIIMLMEIKLRQMEDLKKEESSDADNDHQRRGIEKSNLEKETAIYRYISLFRSFLPSGLSSDNLLSGILKDMYGLDGLSELLLIITEALIFQRPMTPKELTEYFNITHPVVSNEKWDYYEETLKKLGKDPASKKRKEVERLKIDLEPYEDIVKLLMLEDNGRNLLLRGAEHQLLLMENRHNDPAVLYEEDFFTFIDAIIQYFKNAYLPLLDGSAIFFRDSDRNEHEGSILEPEYFKEEMIMLSLVLEEMHLFKGNNPSLAIKRSEVKKALKKQLATMANIEEYVKALGNFFYKTGKKLNSIYDLHKSWIYNRTPLEDIRLIREPLKKGEIEKADREKGRPLPFFDCTIKDFYRNNALTKKLIGKKITGKDPDDGILIQITAFLFQAAAECFDEHLNAELEERKNIVRRIDELNR